MDIIRSYLRVIRYPLFAIPIVATLPGALIASSGQLSWRVGLALLIALFGYFAGMMKNDYFHQDRDLIVNPHRPIPSKDLSSYQVLVSASVIYILCVVFGFMLNYKAGLLVIFLVMISHLYNAILSQCGVWGSVSLPIGIGTLSVFGAIAVSGQVPRLVWYAFTATALYDFGTHIITTFKDIELDRRVGVLSTPLQLGVWPALILSAVVTFFSFGVAVLPYWTESVSWHYISWVILALVATVVARIPLYIDPNEENGYLALKGSMVGAIVFFPCLIGAKLAFWQSALIVLPLLLLTLTLLEISKQKV